MIFLEWLATLRNPVFDALFLLITRLGEEVLFMAVALIFFWCGNKIRGYYLLSVGFVGTIGNQVLKLLFRIPRPWVRNPDFAPVKDAVPAATGYSFPSGHTQTATGLYGGIAYTDKKVVLRILGIGAVILVAFSRMYLGVHTPADVLVSLGIGTALVLLLRPLFSRIEKNHALMYPVSLGMILLAFANLIFVHVFLFPAEGDMTNINDGIKNAWSLFGAVLGIPVIFCLDEKYIRFSGEATPFWQLLKVVIGLTLLIFIKEALKVPLNLLPGGAYGVSNAIRYFAVVLLAGAGYPALFRFLPKKNM